MTRDEILAAIQGQAEPIKGLFMWLRERGGKTFADMARYCDVDATVLSKILSNKYDGNLETILARIESAKRRDDKWLAHKFVETEISDCIFNVLDRCRDYGNMAMVSGTSGRGKTHCVREWIRRQHNTIFSPIYIDVPVDKSLRGLLREMGKSLGIRDVNSTRKLKEMIEDKITNRHIIILDECFRLIRLKDPTESIEFIRRLHDTAGCGVYFSATKSFSNEIELGRFNLFFEQLVRRLEDNYALPDKVTRAEVKKHLGYYTDGVPDRDILKIGVQIAERKEKLAGLQRMINNALLAAQDDGRTTITAEDLEVAVMDASGKVQFSE